MDQSTYQVGTDPSQISHWSQSLSIDNGVVSTSLSWSPHNSTASYASSISLKYTIFAHRTRPNLGVVRLDVSGISPSSNVSVTDVLDGAGSWRTTAVGKGVLSNSSIYTAVQPNGITNVTAYEISQLQFLSATSKAVNSTGCFAGVSQNASTVSQCYTITPSKGSSFSVIKYVGIASSDAFPSTEKETALNATTSALKEGYEAVLAEHTAAWSALWDESDIVIPGESKELKELQLVTRASLFHLLSNVREGYEPTGLGDNSIAPAGLTSDSYAGQIFWDAVSFYFLRDQMNGVEYDNL